MKYSELIAKWLTRLGYTHCFFVAGGNVMHLLDAFRSTMVCIPFVHEVGAAIAVEYYNESKEGIQQKAFLLVTAGPGLTNVITAMAGAWLESRELLVIGGQVKTTDLARGQVRQRGIQEIDGIALTRSITKHSHRFDEPIRESEFVDLVLSGSKPRRGPVFLELPLDVQAKLVSAEAPIVLGSPSNSTGLETNGARTAGLLLKQSSRPVLLLGSGFSRACARALRSKLKSASIAIMTTYNGADRMDDQDANYFGRPNTWGQRYANILIQQADVVVCIGTRLGIQQTGFNWQAFAPMAKVVQIDIDQDELKKGHPNIDFPIHADADTFVSLLLDEDLGTHDDWLAFCTHVKAQLPLCEKSNLHREEYIDPYQFYEQLANASLHTDIVLPCSSGSTFTVGYQAFRQKFGQIMISNKSLASMGYGLSGAIGASIANPQRRVISCEGDGGFSQNLQELGTLLTNNLNVKIFLFSNEGYASIRMTQKNYFGGAYLGCDTQTGLGFPHWQRLFGAYGLRCLTLDRRGVETPGFTTTFEDRGPAAFVVPIDPEQTYFPKISSRVKANGGMESSPLHLMTPELAPEIYADVMRYVPAEILF